MSLFCSEVVVPVGVWRMMIVRGRVGVILGICWLPQHRHIVIQRQDHVL